VVGSGQVLVRVQGHVFVLWILAGTGSKALGPLAFEFLVSNMDAGDQAE
jgi:hypothetical protein